MNINKLSMDGLHGAGRAVADAWALAVPFWRAPGERRAWALLAGVVGLTLSAVWLNVRFSDWNNSFYNTLQNHDLAAFWQQLGLFGVLAAAFIVVAVYRQYLQQLLFMRWRTWLTQRLARGWLQPGTAYRLGAAGTERIDNPDQRIAEDARGFVSSTLDLGLGLLNASVTLVSFAGILWGLSGAISLPFAPAVTVPGYMLWVALGYSLLGTCLAHWLGRPLVGLNSEQQKVEADFRYALVQVRDHAEAIALARGETREGLRLASRFDAVRDNWAALIRTTKRLTWFSAGYGQLANVFPILAAAPRYFSGAIQLGGLMQTAQAFGQVQGAMSWFIDAYPRLAEWRATVNRLTLFTQACERDGSFEALPRIALEHADHDELQFGPLVLAASDGRVLARTPAARFEAGGRVLVTGPSGCGKSTLLRTVAGLTRLGDGHILLPRGASLMFVPQRPYLPEGSLRDALAYPRSAESFEAQAVASALLRAGLGRYADRLDTDAPWSSILSPGEQQRVHFARVLLHRPDWVFLDESTSALDESSEAGLYAELKLCCPDTTVVSVGHRSTLQTLHDKTWLMRANEGASSSAKSVPHGRAPAVYASKVGHAASRVVRMGVRTAAPVSSGHRDNWTDAMTSSNNWAFWAVLSAIFAALTAIFAKVGIRGVDSDLATLVRTSIIIVVLSGFVWFTGKWSNPLLLTSKTWLFLGLSGLATGASWVCYFRALQIGDASKVAPVDKLSLVLVAIFAFAFLGERPSLREWLGIAMVAAGVLVLAIKR